MSELKEKLVSLKKRIKDIPLIYIEENHQLREQMKKLFNKLFTYYRALEDGESGLKAFKKNDKSILILDLAIPKLSGLALIKEVRKINPFAKIIVLTADDSEENLVNAMHHGVHRYLKKPVKPEALADSLSDVVSRIELENGYLTSSPLFEVVVNNQTQMIMLLHKQTPVLVNQSFLNVVDAKNLNDYLDKFSSMDDLLLEEEGFLYSKPGETWLEHVLKHPEKLYHVKIKTALQSKRHMILKINQIADKKNSVLLTFDDVTDLNLCAMVNKFEQTRSGLEEDYGSIEKLMNVVYENQAEIILYSDYKGLSIINKGRVVAVCGETVTIKTSEVQLKILEHKHSLTLSSEFFSSDLVTKNIEHIDYKEQTVVISHMHFLTKTALQREYQRLEPHGSDTVSLFYHGSKLYTEITIVDLSKVAVKLNIKMLPVGMKEKDRVKVSLLLEHEQRLLSITMHGSIKQLYKEQSKYFVVVMFEYNEMMENKLNAYLHERQLELIKEFKTL